MISGEGEEVFGDVLDSLIAGKNISSLEIPGLWHKGSGKNCGTATLKNINQPVIDRGILSPFTVKPKWQKWINKIIPPETVLKFYDDCKNIGIKTGALFMRCFILGRRIYFFPYIIFGRSEKIS